MSRIFILTILVVVGCSPSVREEKIEVKAANDPLNAPRSILKRYAEGQALGSEAASFPKLVEDVRAIDPVRAEVLENGLNAIQNADPDSRPALARGLLDKIKPSPQ